MGIRLLADVPDEIEAASHLRWQEWGAEPGHEGQDWWVQTTTAEAARHLPASWIAMSTQGNVLGVVGVGEFDIAERRDRSPWVLGMVVATSARGQGIGRRLLYALEEHLGRIGFNEVWVATGQARDFYARCGYNFVETLIRVDENQLTNVMTKSLNSTEP